MYRGESFNRIFHLFFTIYYLKKYNLFKKVYFSIIYNCFKWIYNMIVERFKGNIKGEITSTRVKHLYLNHLMNLGVGITYI